MILAFKAQFIESLKRGSKIHTIRLDPHRRWKKGRKIHFATGVRTKNYNQFKEEVCTGVEEIFMTYAFDDIIEVTIGGRYLQRYEVLELAKNDGFVNWQDFFNWFYPIIQSSEDKYYSGRIIHWTSYRYTK